MNRKDTIKTILVMSAMIDLLILAEMARVMKPSVIGRAIIPMDNSYATSVETDCDTRVYGKKFVCLTEPYKKEVANYCGTPHYAEMVKVKSVETGREYEIMFAEEFLVSES